MNAENQALCDKAFERAQVWIDNFRPHGKPDIDKIQSILSKRTFKGELVEARVAKCPEEALNIIINWAKKAIEDGADGADEKEVREEINNAYVCIWDYYLMSFYESACSILKEKEFPGSEFIYQSLLPAFNAGLGYLINLGPLIIGVCLPEGHVDDEKRIHKGNGPAIIWGNDKQYWWHGVRVEEDWIMNPDSIDPVKCINHENIEQRRALCEIVGWDKVLQGLNPVVLDVDDDPQIGTLLQADIPDHGSQKFLRVLEESTGRQFAILAPDEVETALEAQSEINQIPKELFKLGFVRS